MTKLDKRLILIDVLIGLWWGVIYVFIFNTLRQGDYVWEPSPFISHAEFILSIILTLFFIVQMPYWLSRNKSRNEGV